MTATTKPTVRMYMDRQTHAISPDEDILSALGRLIKEGVTGVPVIDAQGHLIGRLSEYECLRLLAEGQGGERPHGTVRDFMSTEFTSVPQRWTSTTSPECFSPTPITGGMRWSKEANSSGSSPARTS